MCVPASKFSLPRANRYPCAGPVCHERMGWSGEKPVEFIKNHIEKIEMVLDLLT